MSAIVRNRYEHGENIELGYETFKHLLDSSPRIDDPFVKIDLLLKHALRVGGRVDRPFRLDVQKDFPLIFAEDPQEFGFYIAKAIELRLLEIAPPESYRLTLNGWKRLNELNKVDSQSDQAFVAMWFDKSLDSVWEKGFKSGLTACNLEPVRIDLEEHNEKICDRIILEIRRSGLVVADFTGQRGGVYFESGYAMGLGIPVIRTCRKDQVDSLHFDTRQYNHILWESPEDLYEKLINRVRATLSLNVVV